MSKGCFTSLRRAKSESTAAELGWGAGVKNCVRELRTAKGWSQGELAERLGVSRQTVNAIETERYDPSLPLAFALAILFSKRIEDLFEPGKQELYFQNGCALSVSSAIGAWCWSGRSCIGQARRPELCLSHWP